jgi:benzoate transport
MSATDPREVVDRSAMTTAQITVVAITVLLNAMDGFDILSIAFAGPGIAKEWGVRQLELGIVLSMELIGMAFGSVLLGGLADKIGRRPTLLGCLLTMASGMVLATTAASPVQLSIWRVMTGLGIGGMLSCINAVVAEFSNNKWRSVCISLMVIGYPLGGGIGGLYASNLIARYDWRAVFYFGSAATAILIPVVFFLVPESVHWLTRKQPADALNKINQALEALGHRAITVLPEVHADEQKKTLADIFSPDLFRTTLIVTLAYFAHVVSFYFLLKWAPKLVTDMGFAASEGGRILTMGNFGGAAGGAVFGLLTARLGLKPLTISILLLNALAIPIFGRSPADLTSLTALGIMVGFFGNAAMSGLYSIAAYAFPTHVRATGTGFVVGLGRGGAVLSPWLVGYLLQNGETLPTVGLVMGFGSLLAAGLLMFLKLNTNRPISVESANPSRGLSRPALAVDKLN